MWRASPAVFLAVQQHARETYPLECVGALYGRDGELRSAKPLNNASSSPRHRFSLSARDYLAAEREAEALGLQVLGFYHSHPDCEAVPSAEDAAYGQAGWCTLIVPVTKEGAGAPRAWRFDERRRQFSEHSLSPWGEG